MKFVVEQASKGGGRLGRLTGLRSQPTAVHDTPLSMISTLGGSAPHLTQDVLHLVVDKEVPVCFPAQHFCDLTKTLQKFKKGVAQFSALKSHSVCVTVQDATKMTPSGYNEKKGISVWTYGGRQVIASERYMELVEAMQPDWYEALNDADTDVNSSKKRISKSIMNSTLLLDQCIDISKKKQGLHEAALFVPLLGGYNEDERKRFSKAITEKIKNESVSGFSLLGLHTNGTTAEKLDSKLISNLVKVSLDPLPQALPRQASGAWNPLTVITLVQQGVDIFDSSFPYLVTERKGALIFPISLTKENLEHQNKKLKSDNNAETSNEDKQLNKEDEDAKENIPEDELSSAYEMCLKDKSNLNSTKPLLDGCQCYTCQNFTQAYIHHLLNVNELLGPVLLMVHNLHHWMAFFKSIRSAVKDDSLENLKSVIQSHVSAAGKL
ncbi:queuine tRNA-ribosyltransferase accessory subunit 2-like [Penaeus chinensis]|uniref:queuine tRNA-ribosyltransferase accessory subunit 2-like n=1 Tax=Penaeus chinensis TaxID=139456 RepID=UPI001FB67F80|nr:queuine tRNA-ribosyltransferase accessory subunit 2-like [Penaeus chinensis]